MSVKIHICVYLNLCFYIFFSFFMIILTKYRYDRLVIPAQLCFRTCIEYSTWIFRRFSGIKYKGIKNVYDKVMNFNFNSYLTLILSKL